MFDDDALYLTNDEALKKLGTYSTLAHWRCEGVGPAYIKIGLKTVAYRGADLNAWLTRRRVQTEA